VPSYLGELLSALAPMAWAFAVVLFKAGGREVGPLQLNLFKNTVALVLLGLTLALVGGWSDTEPWQLGLLLVSGVVGIALADTCFLWALNLLGAARMGVVSAGYPVAVILLSFAFLGDRFGLLQWVGAAAVIAAIVLSSLPDRREPEVARLGLGVAVGLLSVVLMAVGIVMAKPALDCTPVVWASVLRLSGGNAALALYCLIRRDRARIFSALLPARAWRFTLPGAVVGTYLAYMLWLGGMKYADVSVAAVLNQLSVVFIAVLAWLLLRERLTRAKVAAVVLGVAGSAVVALGSVDEEEPPECRSAGDPVGGDIGR